MILSTPPKKIGDPSLALVGQVRAAISFRVYEYQSIAVARYFAGRGTGLYGLCIEVFGPPKGPALVALARIPHFFRQSPLLLPDILPEEMRYPCQRHKSRTFGRSKDFNTWTGIHKLGS
jgi:hypothetical protein